MSNNIRELLKGKGLLAELEDCRNEEEAINVLKRENLWGIINYPELEELKESYKNGEIEADGTLSLSQLDKVAGGTRGGRQNKSHQKRLEIFKKRRDNLANTSIDVARETTEGTEYEAENRNMEHPDRNEEGLVDVVEAVSEQAEKNIVDIKIEEITEDKNEEKSENLGNKEDNKITVEEAESVRETELELSRTDYIKSEKEQIIEDRNEKNEDDSEKNEEVIEAKSTIEQKEGNNELTSDVKEEKPADEATTDEAVGYDNGDLDSDVKDKDKREGEEETSEKPFDEKNALKENEADESTNEIKNLVKNGQTVEEDNIQKASDLNATKRDVFYIVDNETGENRPYIPEKITTEQRKMIQFIVDNEQLTAKTVEQAIKLGGGYYVEEFYKAFKEGNSLRVPQLRQMVKNAANGQLVVMRGGGNGFSRTGFSQEEVDKLKSEAMNSTEGNLVLAVRNLVDSAVEDSKQSEDSIVSEAKLKAAEQLRLETSDLEDGREMDMLISKGEFLIDEKGDPEKAKIKAEQTFISELIEYFVMEEEGHTVLDVMHIFDVATEFQSESEKIDYPKKVSEFAEQKADEMCKSPRFAQLRERIESRLHRVLWFIDALDSEEEKQENVVAISENEKSTSSYYDNLSAFSDSEEEKQENVANISENEKSTSSYYDNLSAFSDSEEEKQENVANISENENSTSSFPSDSEEEYQSFVGECNDMAKSIMLQLAGDPRYQVGELNPLYILADVDIKYNTLTGKPAFFSLLFQLLKLEKLPQEEVEKFCKYTAELSDETGKRVLYCLQEEWPNCNIDQLVTFIKYVSINSEKKDPYDMLVNFLGLRVFWVQEMYYSTLIECREFEAKKNIEKMQGSMDENVFSECMNLKGDPDNLPFFFDDYRR